MTKTGLVFMILCSFNLWGAENWKGEAPASKVQASVMTGVGTYGISGGFALFGSVATVLMKDGFLEDVNEQSLIEFKIGPTVFSGGTATQFNLAMRWDFILDELWKFSASGGIGGASLPSSVGGVIYVYPYLALGAQYCLDTHFSIRSEVAANFLGVGLNYNF